jgi:PAP_fibrillin
MMIRIAFLISLLQLSAAFVSLPRSALYCRPQQRLFGTPSAEAVTLKNELLSSIQNLKTLRAQDGDFSIDFGVKGGELNSTSRAPQKVNYYSISDHVGKAADAVMAVCEQLANVSPTKEPTLHLGDQINGTLCPLNGAWKLLFTTAADASFSKNSTRGDARAQNVVDGVKGRITNIIDFCMKEDGTEPVLKQLNVVIKATALSKHRVGLQFQYVKAHLTKLFFIPIKWTLYIPVPAAFITRCIVFFSRVFKGQAKAVPQAYFDVLYLDKDLRIHKTGEDNLFVQARETWEGAQGLLE